MKLVVVGIPKTIDNDIQILDKTFGFDTAVEEAQRAINAAYVEVMEIGSQIVAMTRMLPLKVKMTKPTTIITKKILSGF